MSENFGGFFDKAMSGGGGAPGFKFEKIGDTVHGEVTDIFETIVMKMDGVTKKLDKNGAEIPQLNVTLQTDLRDWAGVIKVPYDKDDNGNETPKAASEDDGKRRVFLKYQASRAVGEAIAAAGSQGSDFRKGAKLALKYVADQPMKEGEMKLFEAHFKPAEPTAADFAFGNEPAADAAPAQEAAPAATSSAPWGDTPSSDEPPF